MEAALAWCHVQHSQKQVPVVPKEDVKKLVEFQLSSGKPIRAPWYRPQKDEDEEDVESEVESEQEALTSRETQQDPVESEAQAGRVSPPPAEPPRSVTPIAEDPSSDDEHDLAVAQIVVKPQRTAVPLRTAPSRTDRSAAMRMAPMPPMQQMVSSPPADAPPQSTSPTRMSSIVVNPAPVRMPTSPTRMSQMITTPSPVRMSAGRMMPSPQRRCAAGLPHYRSEAPPGHMMGYAHTPKRIGGHSHSRASVGRSGGHGTGFFVPAGMVLPA